MFSILLRLWWENMLPTKITPGRHAISEFGLALWLYYYIKSIEFINYIWLQVRPWEINNALFRLHWVLNHVSLLVRALSGHGYLKFKYIETLSERIVLYKNNHNSLLRTNGNYQILMAWKIILTISSWPND